MYVLTACVLMVHNAVPDRAGVCCVSTEDLVLFIYSVQHVRKFQWLLGFYALHPAGTLCVCGLSSACLPNQVTV